MLLTHVLILVASSSDFLSCATEWADLPGTLGCAHSFLPELLRCMVFDVLQYGRPELGCDSHGQCS